jgi:uncharacterized protein (TIGR02145 family)
MVLSIIPSSAQQLSQKVGTNPTIINPSSALEVESTTKGFLPPRMTSVQMNAIVSPATGLMVYCMDCSPKGTYQYSGTVWEGINGNGSPSAAQVVISDCSSTGIDCLGLTVSVKMTNNSFLSAGPISFSTSDVVLSGLTGYAVTAVSPASATIAPGANQTIIYTITKTNTQDGTLTATWTKLGLSCSATKALGGDAAGVGGAMTVKNGLATSTGTHSGSNYTLATYSTGQSFSENTACAGKYVSAGYTAATCTGSVTGASGTVYPLVLINGQCWMQRNLNEIPSNYAISPAISAGSNNGWHGYYLNASSELAAGEGRLYTWNAAMNIPVGECAPERAQGVCPAGFHIPSDCEWMYLAHGLGLSLSRQMEIGTWQNQNEGTVGYKLRSQGGGQTNISGFSCLLTGALYDTGGFSARTASALIWTSTNYSTTDAYRRLLDTTTSGISRGPLNKSFGQAVRCIKD